MKCTVSKSKGGFNIHIHTVWHKNFGDYNFFGGGKFPRVWILGTKFHESGYAILDVNYRVFSKNWFCQFFKIYL